MAATGESSIQSTSATLRKTVAVVDMVAYGSISKILEQNIGPASVAELNRQIQSFIISAIERLPDQQAFCVVARTGDGIILLFDNAEDAHSFARHVHLFAKLHNDDRTESTAQRWFRIGIATGDISATSCTDRPAEFAGTVIANAVRLEGAANPSGIIIDTLSFAALSAESKLLYSPEETVHGKRNETFKARRYRVTCPSTSIIATSRPLPSRRAFFISAAAATAAASAAWLHPNLLDSWLHPLPIKRFVALLGWPPLPNSELKPTLLGVIDKVVSELARAEASDSNLFITTQGTAADLTTTAQLGEAQNSLGANLILATAITEVEDKIKVVFQLLESPTRHPLRLQTLTLPASSRNLLYEQAVRQAAIILDIKKYQPDDMRLGFGTSNRSAHTMFEEAEALVKKPNDAGLDASIDKYQQAVNLDPNYAVAYAKLALAYFRTYVIRLDPAALSLARANADTALHLDPNVIEGHLALASIYTKSGDLNAASEQYDRALAIDPANPRTLIDKARFNATLNRWSLAEDTFNRLLNIRPNLWLAHIELGMVFNQQGKYPDALREFRAASIARPSGALAFSNIGAILLQQGRLPDAVDNLGRSLQLEQNAVAASTLASALRGLGRFNEAIQSALMSTNLAPLDALNWLELGDSYAAAKRAADAHGAYLKAVDAQKEQLHTEPRDGPGWMVLALASAKSGDFEGVQKMIEKADSLAADDLDSQLYKVRTLELLGNQDQAVLVATQCVKRGATLAQLQLTPDLDHLREDHRFQQIFHARS